MVLYFGTTVQYARNSFHTTAQCWRNVSPVMLLFPLQIQRINDSPVTFLSIVSYLLVKEKRFCILGLAFDVQEILLTSPFNIREKFSINIFIACQGEMMMMQLAVWEIVPGCFFVIGYRTMILRSGVVAAILLTEKEGKIAFHPLRQSYLTVPCNIVCIFKYMWW